MFVTGLESSETYTPHNKDTRVVFLSAEYVARGVATAEQVFGENAHVFEASEAGAIAADAIEYTLDTEPPQPEACDEGCTWSSSHRPSRHPGEARAHKYQRKPVIKFSGPHPMFLQGANTPKNHRTVFWFRED